MTSRRRYNVLVAARDGVALATDLYFPDHPSRLILPSIPGAG